MVAPPILFLKDFSMGDTRKPFETARCLVNPVRFGFLG